MALTKEDWNEYAGYPNEFFAAPGNRILHEDIPEQAEEFWNDFLEGRNGKGFGKIDCPENRALLLQKYADATGYSPVVRSRLNDLWRKYVISYSVFDHGFIDPNPEPEVEVDHEALQFENWAAWVDDPQTKTKDIREKRGTDAQFEAWFTKNYGSELQPTAVSDAVQNSNVRQTPPAKKTASPEVQRFAAEYRTMSVAQIRTLLSPGMNPQGPAAAKHNQELFDQGCAFGLIA
jgi:hypothetical protein